MYATTAPPLEKDELAAQKDIFITPNTRVSASHVDTVHYTPPCTFFFFFTHIIVAMTAEHPATIAKGRETKFYCVGSGPEKDKVYFIDQHKNS